MKIVFIFVVLQLSLQLAGGIFWSGISQELAETSQNRGIFSLKENYTIFPEGRPGNNLYKDNKWIFSRSDVTLIDLLETFDGIVYYGTRTDGKQVLDYVGDSENTFSDLGNGYSILLTKQKHRKIFRIGPDKRLQDILPKSKTARGLIHNGVDRAAFYHISSGKTVETESGKVLFEYGFNLHLIKDKGKEEVVIASGIKSFSPQLRLVWTAKNTLQYTLSNGQKIKIPIE